MELVIFCSVVLAIFVGGLSSVFLADREGWSETMRRISRKGRARLEVAVGTREKVAGKELAVRDRAAEMGLVRSDPVVAHKIVKLDYSVTTYGPWPRWVCKCGSSDRNVASRATMRAMERKTKRDGDRHVKMMTPRVSKTGSADFLF